MQNKFLGLAAASVAVLGLSASADAAVVISEVYGGGGNTGAPLNQDFVELFNNGTIPVSLSGFTLQYASATGSFTNTIFTFPADTSIDAGQFLVIGAGPVGSFGSSFTRDFVGNTNPNLAASNGAVRLIDVSTPPAVVDLAGYGNSINFEGTAAAPPPSNTTSIQRTQVSLFADTDQNSVDFVVAAPTPGMPIPEPTGLALVGLAGAGLLARRRK